MLCKPSFEWNFYSWMWNINNFSFRTDFPRACSIFARSRLLAGRNFLRRRPRFLENSCFAQFSTGSAGVAAKNRLRFLWFRVRRFACCVSFAGACGTERAYALSVSCFIILVVLAAGENCFRWGRGWRLPSLGTSKYFEWRFFLCSVM